MNLRRLNHIHHRFLFLKAWYFLAAAAIFAVLSIYGLRDNYQTMTKLREAVYVADEKNGDINGALTALREHVYGHMNTDLSTGSNTIKPPVQLKNEYNRLSAGGSAAAKQANEQVAAKAQETCGAQFPGEGFNAPRVECIQEYVRTNASAKETNVPDELYKFDFISPRWSPDVAGFSILLTCLFGVLFLARVSLEYFMRRKLR